MPHTLITTSPRLVIRQYTLDDLPYLQSLLSDPVTVKFWPAPFSPQQSEDWLNHNLRRYRDQEPGRWALIRSADGAYIGDAGIPRTLVNGIDEYDLGYIIHHPYHRQGYGFEAARACLDYGIQTLGLHRIIANMASDHLASSAIARKLGMRLESTFLNTRNRMLSTLLYVWDREEK